MGSFGYLILILCTTLIRKAEGDSVTCWELEGATFSDASPYDNLPVPQCFLPTYKLYTRTVSSGVVMLTNVPSQQFSNSKRTIIIVHGWNDSPTANSQWMKILTEKLLEKGDFNVIETDWSTHGTTRTFEYKQAAANTRVAGKAISLLFANLVKNGLSQSNTHCIGHSIGAHICGYAGKDTLFGRISGLDPAGPEFENLDLEYRLSKNDADFVDVIHTDGGGKYILDYGTLINMGHADFYPNGGKRQPGCSWNRRNIKELGLELDLNKQQIQTLQAVERSWDNACSHKRAISLYIESVGSRACKARQSCTDYNRIVGTWWRRSTCSSCTSVCQEMGYHSIHYQHNQGLFYLETTSNKGAYCKG